MTREQRVRYDVLVRVGDFGTANRELFPESSVAGQAFAQVTQSVTDIEAHFADRIRAAEEARKVKAGKRRAVIEAMKAITHTGRGWATRVAGHNLFRLPRRQSALALLEAARRFIVDAEVRKEEFVRLGLTPDFVTELRTAVDAFAHAVEGRRAGRADGRTARAALEAAVVRGFAAVRTLDVVVVNAVRRDPVRAAAWDGARRIEGSRRASATAAVAGASATTTAPASTTVVAPAAVTTTGASEATTSDQVTPFRSPDDVLSKAS